MHVLFQPPENLDKMKQHNGGWTYDILKKILFLHRNMLCYPFFIENIICNNKDRSLSNFVEIVAHRATRFDTNIPLYLRAKYCISAAAVPSECNRQTL